MMLLALIKKTRIVNFFDRKLTKNMMFTPVLLFKKIGIQFNLLPKKRHEDKTKIYYLGKEIIRKLYN